MSFDLSGLLQIQKDYLFDLSALTLPNSQVGGYVNQLQGKLNTIYSDYSTSNISNISNQNNLNQVSTILDNENSRLENKKQQIDNQLFSQQRLIELNDSQRKKQSQYNYIILVIVIAIIIFILLYKIQIWLPIIPSFITNLLLIILIFSVVVYVSILLMNINNRDSLYFDKIRLNSPVSTDASSNLLNQQKEAEKGNLFNSIYDPNRCAGPACCSANSKWNPYINKCDIICPGPSDPADKSVSFNGSCIVKTACDASHILCGNSCIPNSQSCYNVETFTNNILEVNGMINTNIPKPYEPSEYTSYSVV